MAPQRLLLACVILVLSCAACASAQLSLALDENFDDFDLSLWKHELTLGGGGNWEFQYYTNNRSNSYTEDGILHIKPTLLSDQTGEDFINWGTLNIWGAQPADVCTGNAFYGCERTGGAGGNVLNPVKSARIRTAESFSFTYGKVEVRAKLPRGDWLWPAIWLLPTDNQYGGWPASGEIDIMESRGNNPNYTAGGYDRVGSTLHWGPDYSENMFQLTTGERSDVDYSADFHTYGLIWNEDFIGMYIDSEDNPVLSVDTSQQSFWERGGWGDSRENPWRGRGPDAPFDRRFYLLINLAVGGTTGYFPDDPNYPKPWINTSPNAINDFYNARDQWYPTWTQTFQIDWVRVWTTGADTTGTTPTSTTDTTPTSTSATSGFTTLASLVGNNLGLLLILGALVLKLF